MALGLGESDKTTAKQILRRRQLPLKDFEQKTGKFQLIRIFDYTFFIVIDLNIIHILHNIYF